MASTDNAKVKANQRPKTSVVDDSFRQGLRAKVTTLINTHFSNTLAKMSPQGVPHVVNLVMALIYKESTFRPTAAGPKYNMNAKGTEAFKYANSTAIKPILQKTGGPERANAVAAAGAFGLMQVNGYYAIRGAINGSGELMRARPDLAGPLMLNPGEDVGSKLLGVNNVDNQLLAGLIMLEQKYKMAPNLVDSGRYSSRLWATLGSYLGNGARDSIGTTPEGYARDILEGKAYALANGSAPIYVADNKDVKDSEAGPVKTAASGQSLSMPGC